MLERDPIQGRLHNCRHQGHRPRTCVRGAGRGSFHRTEGRITMLMPCTHVPMRAHMPMRASHNHRTMPCTHMPMHASHGHAHILLRGRLPARDQSLYGAVVPGLHSQGELVDHGRRWPLETTGVSLVGKGWGGQSVILLPFVVQADTVFALLQV